MLGFVLGGLAGGTIGMCIVYMIYSLIYYQLSRKKLAMNLADAEEKI